MNVNAKVALVCASHSPLIYCYARPPACHEESERQYAQRAAEIRAFDPELVIVFGPDHFNGFFLDLMPPFCAGLKCQAVGDIGGFAGRLTSDTISSFSVGPIVPWAEAGVGAVATQSLVLVDYGPHGLDLMRSGLTAPQASISRFPTT